MSVCSEIHTKHINTAVWAERRICEPQTGGTYGYHWALRVKIPSLFTSNNVNDGTQLHQNLSITSDLIF